ncbi:MAG: hypothetical protein N838_17225 [Thiohalocapsa sp. PB-PSB1]|jgi:ammonia channel protein AmtB|nr:MAG: hypothetical protein N838_17225 [Thiohalocapsa sp. PB-PSB1]
MHARGLLPWGNALLLLLFALVFCPGAWATDRQEAKAAAAAAETAREQAIAAGVEIDDEIISMLEEIPGLIASRQYTRTVEVAAEAERALALLSATGASAQKDRVSGLEELVGGIEQRLKASNQAIALLQDAAEGNSRAIAGQSALFADTVARLDPLTQRVQGLTEQAQKLNAANQQQDNAIEDNGLKIYATLMGMNDSKDVLDALNQRLDRIVQRGSALPQRGAAEAEAEAEMEPTDAGDSAESGLLLALVLGLAFPVGVILFEAGRPATGGGLDPGSHGLLAWLGAGLGFVALGFGIMFGPSIGGLIGAPLHSLPDLLEAGNSSDLSESLRLLSMQLPLTGAIGLIACSAVYGRLSAVGCLLAALIAGAVVYPLFGHWTLTDSTGPEGAGWLTDAGFQDPGAATGLAALAGSMALALAFGLGRDRSQKPMLEPEASRVDCAPGQTACAPAQAGSWAAAGALILWAAWLVSVLATAPDMGAVPWLALSSAAAAAGAALAVVLIGSLFPGSSGWGRRLPGGLLVGVVAASAAYAIASVLQMLLLGITTGLVYLAAVRILGNRLGEAADLALMFAVAGTCGSLAPGVFGPEGLLGAGVVGGVLMQSFGLALALALALGAGLLLALLLRSLSWLRVAGS